MEDKDGEPAFPQTIDDMGTICSKNEGMSLRDYFAAKAINALVDNWIKEGHITPEDIASDAYRIADAMLEARKRP